MTYQSYALAAAEFNRRMNGVPYTDAPSYQMRVLMTAPARGDLSNAMDECAVSGYSLLTLPCDGTKWSAMTAGGSSALFTPSWGTAGEAIDHAAGVLFDFGITKETPEYDKWEFMQLDFSIAIDAPIVLPNSLQAGQGMPVT